MQTCPLSPPTWLVPAILDPFCRGPASLPFVPPGVGDRHLQNILVHTASGALVPIDFGYSFGTGTAVRVWAHVIILLGLDPQ